LFLLRLLFLISLAGFFPRVNEEMIETLFICNPANAAPKEAATKRPALPTPKADNKVLLDPKKAQNIAILLRALNVTKEEVCDALCEGEDHPLKLITLILKISNHFYFG
jgi:hypothetical protein